MRLFHKHQWSDWWEDIATYGNMLGDSHEQAVRVRKCKVCKKHRIRKLNK